MKQLLIALLIGVPFLSLRAETRTWTSKAGSKLEAEFAGVTQGKVTLKKGDGSSLVLPLDQLSDMDQSYVKEKAGAGDHEEEKLSTAGEKGTVHRFTISRPADGDMTGEIEGTYEIKEGSLEIEIKRGSVERESKGNSSKRLITGVVISIAMVGGNSFTDVASADRIPIDKTLDDGEKIRLEPQKLVIKHASISADNPEKQWIYARIEVDNDGRTGYVPLHSEFFYGTREPHPFSPRR